MPFYDRIIKLVIPEYDPDKKLVGECNVQDIKQLIPQIRVLKFGKTGVTDKRVVLTDKESSITSKYVASMVINYLIAKGISFDILNKFDAVKAYKMRGNKTGEILFEYKLLDPMDDSFVQLLNAPLVVMK